MKISLSTKWKKTETPFIDAINNMAEFAKGAGVCLDYCEVDRDQWKKLINEMWGGKGFGSTDKDDWFTRGEASVGSVKVVCPEVRDAQLRKPDDIKVTWDGSNLAEVHEGLSKAFHVKAIKFGKKNSLSIDLERFPYDHAFDRNQTIKLDVGDTVTIRRCF